MKKLLTAPRIAVLSAVALYCAGPIIAAALRYPDRRGPLIYPQGYHETVFIISHELFHNGEKPRAPFDRDRPWLYGMNRPLNGRARLPQADIED